MISVRCRHKAHSGTRPRAKSPPTVRDNGSPKLFRYNYELSPNGTNVTPVYPFTLVVITATPFDSPVNVQSDVPWLSPREATAASELDHYDSNE